MVVPSAGVDLDEADAAFHQTPRAEQFRGEIALAVGLAGGGGFLGEIEGLGRLRLHAEGEFEGLDARLELFVVGGAFVVGVVEAVQILAACQRVDVNRTDPQGFTALQMASIRGHAACVPFLHARQAI